MKGELRGEELEEGWREERRGSRQFVDCSAVDKSPQSCSGLCPVSVMSVRSLGTNIWVCG